MIGLICGSIIAVSGVVTGVRHILSNAEKKEIARLKYNSGISMKATYYDPFDDIERDSFTDKPIEIKDSSTGAGHKLVVDKKSGKVLRNVELLEKKNTFEQLEKHGLYVPAPLLYTSAQLNKMIGPIGYERLMEDKNSHYSYQDRFLDLFYMKKKNILCIRKEMSKEDRQRIIDKHQIKDYSFDREDKSWIYYNVLTGDIVELYVTYRDEIIGRSIKVHIDEYIEMKDYNKETPCLDEFNREILYGKRERVITSVKEIASHMFKHKKDYLF